MEIKVIKLKCKKCDYEWVPRKEDVRQCPRCKTAYWDSEREIKNETAESR